MIIQNLILLVVLVLMGALQATALVGVVLGVVKPSLNVASQILPEAMVFFRPEYELVIFAFFVMTTIGAVFIGIRILKERMRRESLWPAWRAYFLTEAGWTFVIFAALQKTVFFDYRPQMAHLALIVLLIASLISKIFFDYWVIFAKKIYGYYTKLAAKPYGPKVGYAVALLFIGAVIYIPHPQHALARMYVGEQFHHFDMSLMAPGWAAYNGGRIDVDQICQYGIGLPHVMATLARWSGGFDYIYIFTILTTIVLGYYLIFFVCCARFFESTALAFLVFLWGVRTQMFHPGDYPFYFTYPSTTALRFCLDIVVFAALWAHLRHSNFVWLWIAGIFSGASVFYLDSTGVFLIVAFYVYVGLWWLIPSTGSEIKRLSRWHWGAVMIAPLVTAFLLFFATTGRWLFTVTFWHNMLETVDYFLSGIGTYPMNESFKYHNFGAGLMGFVIPLVHVATILIVVSLCYLRKWPKQDLLVAVIACYGLGVNHYYIARSLLTCYYVTGLPFMFVCGYWAKHWLEGLNSKYKNKAIQWGIAISLYALVTNHNFMAYPNILNTSLNPMTDTRVAQPLPADGTTYFYHMFRKEPEELKLERNSLGQTDEQITSEKDFSNDAQLAAYYHKDFDFRLDAGMIQSLTPAGQAVALISSFEVKILIQANRPPFFYYFPLINSRPKHLRTWPQAALHSTPERFNKRAIEELDAKKPAYIFMERIFLNTEVPAKYLEKTDQLMSIINYVRAHYELLREGEYLVAMKRKVD